MKAYNTEGRYDGCKNCRYCGMCYVSADGEETFLLHWTVPMVIEEGGMHGDCPAVIQMEKDGEN